MGRGEWAHTYLISGHGMDEPTDGWADADADVGRYGDAVTHTPPPTLQVCKRKMRCVSHSHNSRNAKHVGTVED